MRLRPGRAAGARHERTPEAPKVLHPRRPVVDDEARVAAGNAWAVEPDRARRIAPCDGLFLRQRQRLLAQHQPELRCGTSIGTVEPFDLSAKRVATAMRR